jgi:hypothetical protein
MTEGKGTRPSTRESTDLESSHFISYEIIRLGRLCLPLELGAEPPEMGPLKNCGEIGLDFEL